MPFLMDEEEEETTTTQGEAQTGAPGGTLAGPKQSATSGRYANLNQYLSSNKEQAQKMGSDVAGSVEQKGQAAQAGIEKVAGAAPKVQEFNPDKFFTAPETLTPESKQEYQTFKQTGGYTGPQKIEDVEGYSEAMKGLEAGKAAKALGTEPGQIATLQEQYARPSYQKGQQTLDQLLMQGEPVSKQKMADVSQKYSGLEDLLSGALTKTGGDISAAKTKALTARQALPSAEQAAWQALLSPIEKRAAEQTKANQDLYSRIQEDIQDNILNPETMHLLGLKSGEDLYDFGLSGYVKPDLTQIGVDQAATADERARYGALADLLQDPTRTQITSGGAGVTPVSFDRERFREDVSKKKIEEQGIIDSKFSGLMSGLHPFYAKDIKSPEDVSSKLDLYEKGRAPGMPRGDTTPELVKQLRSGSPVTAAQPGSSSYNTIKAMVDFERSYNQFMTPKQVVGLKNFPINDFTGIDPSKNRGS